MADSTRNHALPGVGRCFEVLKPGGRLILIQPNHRLCAETYYDDPTHRTIFDNANIGEWLARDRLKIRKLVPGLLPFSMKGRLSKSDLLTWLYLISPWKPPAAQMYIVAEPDGTSSVTGSLSVAIRLGLQMIGMILRYRWISWKNPMLFKSPPELPTLDLLTEGDESEKDDDHATG